MRGRLRRLGFGALLVIAAPLGPLASEQTQASTVWQTTDRFDEGIDPSSLSDDGSLAFFGDRFVAHLSTGSRVNVLGTVVVDSSPKLSGNGRYVAFASSDASLVAGDTNNTSDVFIRDRLTGAAERVSVDSTGNQAMGTSDGPSVSADGRFVAFQSSASNLVAADSNAAPDVFLRDRSSGTTIRVSVPAAGGQVAMGGGAAAISANGDRVAFSSADAMLVGEDTNNIVDVFSYDVVRGYTTRLSLTSADGQLALPIGKWAVSANGRFLAFETSEPLVASDANGATDVYVKQTDDVFGRIPVDLVSSNGSGAPGNAASQTVTTPHTRSTVALDISPDGHYVLFSSAASNLVAGDTNGSSDVFVRDRAAGSTTRVSVDGAGNQIVGNSNSVAMSANGEVAAFASNAPALAADGNPSITRAYVARQDRASPDTSIVTGPSSPSSDNTPTFAFTATEVGSTFACRFDGGSFTPCQSPHTGPALSDGPHRFEVRAADSASNVDVSPAGASVVVDTIAPRSSIDKHPAARTAAMTPSFSFRANEPGSRFECRVDGQDFAACTSPAKLKPLKSGRHTFAVRATDVAGNREGAPATFAFKRLLATRPFSIRLKSGRGGKIKSLSLVGVRKGATATLVCLRRCGSRGTRTLVQRRANRTGKLLHLKPRRAITVGTWFEIRVHDPGRVTRYRAFSLERGSRVPKGRYQTHDCLDGKARIDCPA